MPFTALRGVSSSNDVSQLTGAHKLLQGLLAMPGVNVWLQTEKVNAIAERLGKSSTQVLLRWGLQHGSSVIPKASSSDHQQVTPLCTTCYAYLHMLCTLAAGPRVCAAHRHYQL